jgi:hypothetical protein
MDVKYFMTNKPWIVWTLHIIIGLLFLSVAISFFVIKNDTIKATIGEAAIWIILVMSILMISYHGHLLTLYIIG